MPENDDELEQLRRANPVAPGSVPSADSPRARALFEEITLSDDAAFTNRQSASGPRRRRWVGGIAAAIVLIGSGAAAVALRSADGGDGATDLDAAAQPDGSTPPDSPAGSGEDDGASAREGDRAAQSDLRNAFTAARTISTDYQGRFQKNPAGDPIDAAALQAENPNWDLAYGPPGSAGVDMVSVTVSSLDGANSHIWLVAQSSGGTFYCLGGTWTGEVSRSRGESEEAAKATCVGGAQEW